MQCYARKRGRENRTPLVNGRNNNNVGFDQSCFVRSRLLAIGKNELRKRPYSPHRQYSKSLYLPILQRLLWTKPTRLPVRCSCHRSAVSVRKSYTTTSGKTRKHMYYFSPRRRFGLRHGTYIPCLSTWRNIFRLKNGETNISTLTNHDICRGQGTSLDRAGRR